MELGGRSSNGFLYDWKEMSLSALLAEQYDYIICAVPDIAMETLKERFLRIGIMEERIFPISIFSIPFFDFEEYIQLCISRPSIFANHCWGGFTYHTMKLKFTSPFINLYMKGSEYLKLLENPKYYMGIMPVYEREEMERDGSYSFPVGRLDDIDVYFNHYATFEEACKKWEERKKRINWNNLFVEMYSDDLKEIERFENLPYKNKVCFVPFECEYPSTMSVEAYKYMIGRPDVPEWTDILFKMARYEIPFYDALKLLNGKRDF